MGRGHGFNLGRLGDLHDPSCGVAFGEDSMGLGS